MISITSCCIESSVSPYMRALYVLAVIPIQI